jgi:hypothetical protein
LEDDDGATKAQSTSKGRNKKQDESDEEEVVEERPLTTLEKIKRNKMEKEAGWWNKYYASKAKLV